MSQQEKLAYVLSNIFAPDALAAIPEGEKGYDPKIACKVAPNLSCIEPGDLILTRTSSTLYNILRIFTSEPYDHIAVVLNNKLVLHIGPGLVRTLSLVRLLEPKRSPIVLRPILSKQEKDIFLKNCWSMIGEKYDLVRVFDFVLRLILLNWTRIKIPFHKMRINLNKKKEKIKEKKWVCSDGIMDKLINVNIKYKQFLINDKNCNKSIKDIMLNNLGSLTIKDFIIMAQKPNGNLFKIIKLPLDFEKNKNTLYHKLENIINTIKKYLDKFNELSLTQKLLLVILIIYMLNLLCVDNDHKIKSNL